MPLRELCSSALRLSPSRWSGDTRRGIPTEKRPGSPSLFHPDGSRTGKKVIVRRLSSVRLIDKGGRIIPDDLFAKVELERVGKPLTVFHSGVDADFDKPTPRHRIEKPPFYAAWATPVVHDTRAGLRINAACRVIDMNGEVIPGL